MPYKKFRDIPQFTHWANYAVDISWAYLPTYYKQAVEEYHLDPNPDFQRGYVWTPEQKVRYVEYILRGGATGRDIQTNNPDWNSSTVIGKSYVLVDGKQRLEAVLGFLNDEFTVFGGSKFSEFEDSLRMTGPSFKWHVNDLATRAEVLQWYLDLNNGGTVHTSDELDRVRGLLANEPPAKKGKAKR